MMYLSRDVHFSAAHKLYNEKWNKEKNKEVYGVCSNEYYHGHNFDMTVTVKGPVNPETGFVINFKDLKRIVNDEIIEKVDHKNLNIDVDFLRGKLTSCENLILEFWKILEPKIREVTGNQAQLHCIKLKETDKNYAEYYGE